MQNAMGAMRGYAAFDPKPRQAFFVAPTARVRIC
jgi:hypothetical protein